MTGSTGPEGRLFEALQRIVERPEPWAWSTNRALWTTPYLAEQMLRYHLDGSVDAASRRSSFIEGSVAWITERFRVGPGTRVADLGCGPGLYTNRLARTGAHVTGVDLSAHSIDYARTVAQREGLGRSRSSTRSPVATDFTGKPVGQRLHQVGPSSCLYRP